MKYIPFEESDKVNILLYLNQQLPIRLEKFDNNFFIHLNSNAHFVDFNYGNNSKWYLLNDLAISDDNKIPCASFWTSKFKIIKAFLIKISVARGRKYLNQIYYKLRRRRYYFVFVTNCVCLRSRF